MASTNKTTNYDLSQYIASDKPTYLVDYNGDMQKIDTGIAAAKAVADEAELDAGTAINNAANAQETANTAVTNAAAAQSKANATDVKVGELADLETITKTDIVSAVNEVKGNLEDVETALNSIVVNSTDGTETNKAPSVNAIKSLLNGEVLYQSTTGTAGNVTLSKSIKDFKYIDIFYFNSGNEKFIRLETANLTTFVLNAPFIYNGAYYDRMSAYTANNNIITLNDYLAINNNFSQVTKGNAEIVIKKVIGYNY